MAISYNSSTSYDSYDDRDLKMLARSREEYEYLKRQRYEEKMAYMQGYTNQEQSKQEPEPKPKKPAHLNQKLLLTTQGA